MKKFIYGCLLLSFLFTLLYVTPCYAFSKSDVQNLAYNFVTNNDNITNKDLFYETIDNFDISNVNNLDFSEFFDNNDYSLFSFQKVENSRQLYFYIIPNNVEFPIEASSFPGRNFYISNMGSFTINYTTANGCRWTGTIRNQVNTHERTTVIEYIMYIDEQNVYKTNDGNPILLTAPYNTPSWFVNTGPYTEDQQEFTFYINELVTTPYVDILTDNGIGGIYTFENVPVLYSSNNFGYLVDTLENHVLESDALGFYYLSGSGDMWTYKNIYERTLGVNELYSNDYITVNYDSNDYPHISLKNSVIFKNVLYVYNIYDSNQQQVNGIFYLGDSSTVISGGLIDTSNFGDSYFNQFNGLDNIINNNDNTQAIIDNQNNNTSAIISNINDDSNIDNIISGDLSGDYEDFGAKFGYTPYEDPYLSFIWGFYNNCATAMFRTGNFYIHFPLRNGTEYYIYANDIYLTNGTLKTFISTFLTFLIYFEICNMISHWITELETVNTDILKDTDVEMRFM